MPAPRAGARGKCIASSGYSYVPSMWVVLSPKFSKQGPFGRFSLKMSWFSWKSQELGMGRNGWLSAEICHEKEYELVEGTFLKIRRRKKSCNPAIWRRQCSGSHPLLVRKCPLCLWKIILKPLGILVCPKDSLGLENWSWKGWGRLILWPPCDCDATLHWTRKSHVLACQHPHISSSLEPCLTRCYVSSSYTDIY